MSCYLQLGKRGPAHVACGSKCLQNGQPIGLLDDDGKLYIVMAEEHHPRRDGQVDLRSVFIPLLSKMVTVNGMEVETKGYHALFVNAADLGAVKTGATEKARVAPSGFDPPSLSSAITRKRYRPGGRLV